MHLWYNQVPHHLGCWPTDWRIIKWQLFSHRSENSEPPVRVLSLRNWHSIEEHPDHLVWWPNRAGVWELHRSVVKQKLYSWGGCTQGLKCTRTHDKRTDFIGVWVRPTCWSWRVSWGVGVALAHCGGKDTGSGNIHQHELSWTCPTQQSSVSSAGMPQAKQPTRWGHRPIHQQVGYLKSPWAHSHL